MTSTKIGHGKLFVASVSLILLIGYLIANQLNAASVEVAQDAPSTIHTVTATEVDQWMSFQGHIQPVRWHTVRSALNAHIQQLPTRYGETVHIGQLLLTLDTTDIDSKLRKAKVDLIVAEQAYDKLDNWNQQPKVRRTQRAVKKAQQALKSAQRHLRETRNLYDLGIVSALELENQQLSVDDHRTALINAQEAAQQALKSGTAAHRQIAALKLSDAQEHYNSLLQKKHGAHIYSPTSGVLFHPKALSVEAAEPPLHPGAEVTASQALFAIADFSALAIGFSVNESQLLHLNTQQPARVRLQIFPELHLQGKINSIAGQAINSEENASPDQAPRFHLDVITEDIPANIREQLRIGLSAVVEIRTYSNPNAIVIPFEAIRGSKEDPWVDVINANGSREKRHITIARTLLDGVELSTGLESGEKVSLASLSAKAH